MYLKNYLEQYKDKKIKLYVDMDGVIADYDVGKAYDYDKKRPLFDSINKLEIISNMDNIELYILSITRHTEGYNQKQIWLDKYAPFFKKDNRFIISREDNNMLESSLLKANFIKELPRDDSVIIVIDDDPRVIKDIKSNNDDVILLKDTVLVD